MLVAAREWLGGRAEPRGQGSWLPGGCVAAACLLALLLAFPPAARATAGFAESHSLLRYNDLADLEWTSPGDGCDEGSHCFHVVKKGRTGWFRDLYGSLEQVSLPTDSRRPLLFGQRSRGKRWFVYDLGTEETVVETASYDEALSTWRSRGEPSPVFADAQSARGLRETWSSLLGNLAFLLLLWSPALVIVALPALSFVALKFWRRFRTARRAADLILFGLCAAPVAGLALLIGRVLALVLLPRPAP